MINNDVLRSVRYMLDLGDARVAEIIKLTDYDVAKEDVTAFLKKEDESGFQVCSDEVLTHFLDGLVIYKRGKNPNAPAQPENMRLSNNMILKKLRVAFELKEEDLHTIMATANFQVSKPELSALFRKEGQKNYRVCGDQLLRNFLKGMTLCIRG